MFFKKSKTPVQRFKSSIDSWKAHRISAWEHVKDQRKVLCSNKDEFWWAFRTHLRFLLLQLFYRRKPIYVYEWTDFNHVHPDRTKGAGGLDVQIAVPTWRGLRHRWIFTVNSKHDLASSHSREDLITEIWAHQGYGSDLLIKMSKMSNVEFWSWIEENAEELYEQPDVEYDVIVTAQEFFVEEDVVKYARIWLGRWYPKLAKSEIIFDGREVS